MGFIQSSINQLLGVAAIGEKLRQSKIKELKKEADKNSKAEMSQKKTVNSSDEQIINQSMKHAQNVYNAKKKQSDSFKSLLEGFNKEVK